MVPTPDIIEGEEKRQKYTHEITLNPTIWSRLSYYHFYSYYVWLFFSREIMYILYGYIQT